MLATEEAGRVDVTIAKEAEAGGVAAAVKDGLLFAAEVARSLVKAVPRGGTGDRQCSCRGRETLSETCSAERERERGGGGGAVGS